MKWWKASRMDNVSHAERDYLVKAWTGCQFMGLYPRGFWIQATLFPKLHTGMRVKIVAENWWFKKNLHVEHDFYWLFDGMHLLIIKHSITAPNGHWIQPTVQTLLANMFKWSSHVFRPCNQTSYIRALQNYRWAIYWKKKAPLIPK